MATSTVQDQVNSLITRRLAEARSRGVPNPSMEATALFEVIAINFMLNPRAVLYAAIQARNSLLSVIDNELRAIDALKQTVSDLKNISFAILNTQSLEKAKNSLLEIEDLGKVDSNSTIFKRFNSSIDEFLNSELRKNVARQGSTDMIRPGSEAKIDLPTDFSTLKEIHGDLLDRLYALSVGIPNYLSTPLSTIIGLSTANRARLDIEDIIDNLNFDPSASQSRDIAVKLLSARAALKMLGSQIKLDDPVVDTSRKLPSGYELNGTSNNSSPFVDGAAGPYTLPDGAGLSVQVGTTLTESSFPIRGYDLKNQAHVIGIVPTSFVFPPSPFLFIRIRSKSSNAPFVLQPGLWYRSASLNVVSAGLGDYWLLDVDGTFYRQFRVDLSAVTNLTQLLSGVQASLGVAGTAVEFPKVGGGKFAIVANSSYFDMIAVTNVYSQFTPSQTFSSSTALSVFSFTVGQSGAYGSIPISEVVEAFNTFFTTKAIASTFINGSGNPAISISSVEDAPATSMVISGTAAAPIGISGTFLGLSNRLFLNGVVNGAQTSPVNPSQLVDINDTFKSSTGVSTITALSDTEITIADDLHTFDGPITISSAIQKTWASLEVNLIASLSTWLSTSYRSDLKKVDAAISVLVGSATAAQINNALSILDDLRAKVTALKTSLSDPDTMLPPNSGLKDREVFNSIVSMLTERKYDRALDFLTRCKIQEMFELDFQTASFSGAFLDAASNVARSDINFPNAALDEGSTVKAIVPRR